eukprot:354857-Chlamydomonas_euryale.AAC.33
MTTCAQLRLLETIQVPCDSIMASGALACYSVHRTSRGLFRRMRLAHARAEWHATASPTSADRSQRCACMCAGQCGVSCDCSSDSNDRS